MTSSIARAAPGGPFSIGPEHPRLLITAGDVPRLRAQAMVYPAEWKRVQSAGLRPPEDAGYSDARALVNAALAFVVTSSQRDLTSALALSENICRHHRPDTYASPEALFALAIAYDWCYRGFSNAERVELQQGILHIADYLRDDIWRHSDFNNHFVLEKVWPSVYAALALYGDTDDPRAASYLRISRDYLYHHLLPASNVMAGRAGGQLEGYGYDAWGYMRPLALTLEAWRTATGEDLFPGSTAAKFDAIWNIYGRRPFDGRLEHFDDADLDHTWTAADEGSYIYLLARRFHDGRAQWMGDQIPRKYDAFLWPVILWRDPALPSAPPGDLPTARLFDGPGWVLMRSSWSADATFATFQCGPFLTGHQHLDNNAFTIHKRALLAIDSGVNAYGEEVDTGYRTNYYSRTIAHNSLLVNDPNEVFRGGAWAGSPAGGANDGGQMRQTGLERVGEVQRAGEWQAGRIVTYAHDPLYTYAVGDATRSYNSAKLRLFLRHFLFLPPDLFVIFDQVESTNASFRKTWLLHSVGEPAISGAVVTIRNAPGVLTCRTVLPEKPIITRVGGAGKECWVDGRNWPAAEKPWSRDAGAWRLEVSPSTAAKRDLFLHVLQTDGATIAEPGAVKLSREGGKVGVHVHAQGRVYDISFTPGSAAVRIRVEENGRVLRSVRLD